MTETPASALFYLGGTQPWFAGAEGIWVTTEDGRRLIDGSSGAMVSNIGHGNRAVIEAMKRQLDQGPFAYRLHFRSHPSEELAENLQSRAPAGMGRVYLVSGGSEAVESAIKLARQAAIARQEAGRWKVISRFPGYHGTTLGALSLTGYDPLTRPFAPMMVQMPKIAAPVWWRDQGRNDMQALGLQFADLLAAKIEAEGPETVLAFIMEPVGGASTGALVAPDGYYGRIRDICDRYGIFLIHDEVISGIGRTGRFLAGEHWNCRPDFIVLSKGLASGYAPLGAVIARTDLVEAVQAAGGFAHGHTYAGNPLAACAGLAVLGVIDREGLVDNAAVQGEVLMAALQGLMAEFPIIGDVRGKGLLSAIEFVADRRTNDPFPPALKLSQRVVDAAMRRDLILYERRSLGGDRGDHVMVCPPLIVTGAEIGMIIERLRDTLIEVSGWLADQGKAA